MPTEFLLTSHELIHGDAGIDRGWLVRRSAEQGPHAIKRDGTRVRFAFSAKDLRGMPRDTILHFGDGFACWAQRDRDEVHALIHANRCEAFEELGKPHGS